MKNEDSPAVRILLVDDNIHGLKARRMILMEHGYEVETAASGEAAWETFQKNHFDVVVTDYRMGGMNGVDLIKKIHASNSPARTVLLSGFIDCLGLTEQSTGADELISKTNKEVTDLLRTIKKLAARPRRRGASSQRDDESGSQSRRAT
jgi:CheY-like chemotaxis protein